MGLKGDLGSQALPLARDGHTDLSVRELEYAQETNKHSLVNTEYILCLISYVSEAA